MALSLFMVGMVSILQIFPINRRYLTQSAQTTRAVYTAQEQIERLRAEPYDELTTGTYEARQAMSATAGDPYTEIERQTVIALIDSNRAVTQTDVGLKRVTVTVYWLENGQERSYQLATYVYKK